MRKKLLPAVGIMAVLCLNGCRSQQSAPETEALREEITQLQQQVSDLQEQITSGSTETQQEIPPASETPAEGESGEGSPAPEPEASPSDGASALSTTHTMEELTGLVAAFEEKTQNAAPSGAVSEDMEQFLSLKQEEKEIGDQLDRHEDELEYLYRSNALSREEYRTLDRELELLEDRLDASEDLLEYTFGMED